MSDSIGTAVVTGASSGIGVAYAEQLARRGHDLVLVARRKDRLDALAARLSKVASRKVEVLVTDLAKPEGIRSVETLLSERDDIDLLVNNAGLGALGPAAAANADAVESLVLVNVLALTRLSLAAVRNFQKRNRGTLINIASVIALGPAPGAAAYSGSKAYVLNFSRSLEMECANTAVSVQTILPGPVHSEFFEQSGVTKPMFPEHLYMTADQLVATSLKGLELKESVCFPTLPELDQWGEYESARKKFAKSIVTTGIPAQRYA
ncbi:SDR family NAD(P)-dependent oxidoreductase [Bradyrhizobium tropiciagri]|uniref:SDR family NAD(P)-dependent oxidoreductase n=1 Tax=Bradyrhizobium tropiciagri TaxID=312253 RepID=UPI00067B4690|nr:SDR family NAD(P)-dependent oxidoreductase [Bradyrhizobium tropiciagri]